MVASLLYYRKFTKNLADECQIWDQPIQSMRGEQDCQWHANDNMLSHWWLQIESL
jgi:hypothetical protein